MLIVDNPKPVSARLTIPTADLAVYVSGRIEGEFVDWPNNIKDEILLALAKHEMRYGRKYRIIASKCDQDLHDKWYVQVIAQAEEITVQ
jgi:hypothetical protein